MDLTSLMKEAPYVAALLAVVLIFTRAIQQMQAANSLAQTNRDQANTQAQNTRDQLWRDFLSEQRVQTTGALTRLSSEIAAVAAIIGNVSAEQLRHDAWTRESLAAIQEHHAELRADQRAEPAAPASPAPHRRNRQP